MSLGVVNLVSRTCFRMQDLTPKDSNLMQEPSYGAEKIIKNIGKIKFNCKHKDRAQKINTVAQKIKIRA